MRRFYLVTLGLAAMAASTGSCAASPEPPPESQPAEGSGECVLEVINRTVTALGVSMSGSDGPTRRSLQPGGRFRVQRPCDLERVVVTATAEETPAGLPGDRQPRRGGVVERTVAPLPDRVVEVPLRWGDGRGPGR